MLLLWSPLEVDDTWIGGQQPGLRDAAPEEPIEPADLAGFEAVCIAEDLDGKPLS